MAVKIAQGGPVPAALDPQQLAIAQRRVKALFGKTPLQQWLGEFSDLFQAFERAGQGCLRLYQARLAGMHCFTQVGGSIGEPVLRLPRGDLGSLQRGPLIGRYLACPVWQLRLEQGLMGIDGWHVDAPFMQRGGIKRYLSIAKW
ncbi:hypothetical protein D3C79_620520 [compost metagenome]